MPDVLPINDTVARRQFEPGDIIAFYGSDWRSRVIELATWGPSHVGIVSEWPLDAPPSVGSYVIKHVLVESTTLCRHPCLETGKHFDGVQVQDPWNRIEDYQGRAKLFRLAPHRKLTDAQRDDLTAFLSDWIGRPYDMRGALWSGTKILKWLPRMPYSDLGSLFCSEMIVGVLQQLGHVCVSYNAGKFSPASMMWLLLESGVYLPGVPL